MKKIWHHPERTDENRVEAEFRSLKIPFKKRIDAVWILLVITLFTVFILWWLIGVLVGHRLGIFEPPLIRPVKDSRILSNIGDTITNKPLLDAVFQEADGFIYLSQQGGSIHRYNPATALWYTEKPFSKEQLFNPGIVLLRAGCGADPLSYRKSSGQCWDKDSIWGLSVNGGLVRRSKGQWDIVKSDTLFLDSAGKPVEQDQLAAAAVSADRRWLVLGTKENGIGIYSLETGRWIALPEDFYRELPDLRITHLAWSNDRFWIGGPGGLLSFEPDIRPPTLRVWPEIDGTVVDMDVDFQNRLWVLDKHACSSGGQDCLRLSRFDFQLPGENPKILINENHIFNQLNLEDFNFARYWGERLVIAGSAGIYSYDTARHGWERHFNGDVGVTLPFSGGEGFYFGYTGGVGVVSMENHRPWERADKRCTVIPLPYPHINEKVAKLHYGEDNRVLALSLTGKLFSIDVEERKVYLLFEGQHTGLTAGRFRSVLAFGDIVIFFGGREALIHNIVTRSYKDVPVNFLPEWLQNADLQVMASGGQVFAASKEGRKTKIYRISVEDASRANFKNAVLLDTLDSTIRRMCDWDGQGIGLLLDDPDGRIFRYSIQKEALTGMKAMNMRGIPFVDAAPFKDGLIVATAGGLRDYDYFSRTWKSFKRYKGKSSPQEVVQCNDRTWMSTRGGQLLELTAQNKFAGRIGSDRDFDMTDSRLSDVFMDRGLLYLGGNGWVNCYDPDLRRIVESWDLPGSGDVRIIAIVQGRPLTLTQGRAMVGSIILDNSAGNVLDIFVDENYIWTVREQKVRGVEYRYLKNYSRSEPFSLSKQCYFQNPFLGNGERRILDVREILEGNLAVTTEKGLYFYNPTSRSWYGSSTGQFSGRSISGGGWLEVVAGHLVRIIEESKGNRVAFTDLDTLRLPFSCSQRPVIVKEKSRRVQALALHPQDGRIAFIDTQGKIMEWLGGAEIEKLPLPGPEPLSGSLRRVFSYSGDKANAEPRMLLFTTEGGLLSYDLGRRFWSEIPLKISKAGGGDRVKDINVNIIPRQAKITAKTLKGRIYLGSIDFSQEGTPIKGAAMKPIFTPGEYFDKPGSDLRDVQMRSKSAWTFILKDRIKYYYPANREWSDDIVLPGMEGRGGDNPFLYYQVKDRGLIVLPGNGAGTGDVWWIAKQSGHHPVSFARYNHRPNPGEVTALDNNGTLWRFDGDGKLYRMEQPLSGDYRYPDQPYEVPFVLNSQEVRGAYEWPGRILFDTDSGLRFLDKTRHKEIRLPAEVQNLSGIKEVVNDGQVLWLRTRTGRMERLGDVPQNVKVPEKIKNQWPELKRLVVTGAEGKEVFDPISQLIIDANGRLMAQRPGGETYLAQAAAVNPGGKENVPQALDVGWLRWDREKKLFLVKTPGNIISMKSGEFIKNGKLLFEEVDAVIVEEDKGIIAANRYGIWNYPQKDLSPDNPAISFQPVQWQRPQWAAHDYFINRDGVFDTQGNFLSQAKVTHQVVVGDVTLTENIRESEILGQIKHTSGFIDAFSERGFIWDHGKQGLAYTKTDLLITSDAGLHPVTGYTGFEIPPVKGRLYSLNPGSIYIKSGGTWYRREGLGQWRKGVPDPWENRVLVDNSTWKWEMRGGEPLIRLHGANYDFKLTATPAGLALTSDLLQGAAIFKNKLMVMTEAFFETADNAAMLSHLQANRSPAVPARKLTTVKSNQKEDYLLLDTGRQNYYWDPSAGKFVKTREGKFEPNNRIITQLPAGNPVLRFKRERSGTIKKEFRVQTVTGKSAWHAFNFSNRQFPFDLVTSIAARGAELYVGTRVGLQIYNGKSDTGLGDILEFYKLKGRTGEPLGSIEKVGIPVDNPGLIVAYSSGECIKKDSGAGSSFQNCRTKISLTKRLRLQTPFWRFIDYNGRLVGQYRDHNGQYSLELFSLPKGQLPHDSIKDFAVFKGHVFTIWENGWISRHNNLSIRLDGDMDNYNTQSLQPRRFITAFHNLYMEGKQKRVWQYDESAKSWHEIKNRALVSNLSEYLRRRPKINRKNLRLMSPGNTFEYRGTDGHWHFIPWKGDILAIDHWNEFIFKEGKLWAATPLGLVSFHLSGTAGQKSAKVILNPDDFKVINKPRQGEGGSILEISDIHVEKDNSLVVRCNGRSDRVFQGTFEAGENRLRLTPLDIDPFADKLQVAAKENGFWEWQRKGKQQQNRGRLTGKFHGEEVELVGGRFSFDSINSIAFYRKEQVEIGTDSGGWYIVPIVPVNKEGEIDLSLSNFKRPGIPGINPSLIREVRDSQNQDGEKILGLRSGGKEFIRVGKAGISGKTAEFPQYLGNDGFWRYMKEDGDEKLTIGAVKGTGAGHAKRLVKGGRFSDDIVLGLPVSGIDKAGAFILLPTEAGIVRLDETLGTVDVYPVTSLQTGSIAAPRILYMDNRSEAHPVLYLGEDGMKPLQTPHNFGIDLRNLLPEGAEVLAMEDGPQEFIRCRWEKDNKRGWTLFNPVDAKQEKQTGVQVNTLYVNVKEFNRFKGTSQPWMQVKFNPDGIEFLAHGAREAFAMDYPEPVELIAAFVRGKRLLLISKRSLWEINLEKAVAESF